MNGNWNFRLSGGKNRNRGYYLLGGGVSLVFFCNQTVWLLKIH